MPCDPSSMIRFCLAMALECRRGFEQTTDPARRRSWLAMEGQWFLLARSYDNERRAEWNRQASAVAHSFRRAFPLRPSRASRPLR
jgi:hypothetical protein